MSVQVQCRYILQQCTAAVSALYQFNALISGPNYGTSSVCEVYVCARTCSGVLVCLGFHFGQCTNPIYMSLILDDVQASGSVCDGEDVGVPS